MSARDWARFAPSLHVDPGWMRLEVSRQTAAAVGAMTDAVRAEEHDSPALGRLLEHTRSVE